MSSPATTTPTTAGIIYPDHAAEDEYPWAADLLGVRLPVVHVYGTDLHAVPELLDLGRPDRLAEGAARLAEHRPQSVLWACTSGSFLYGWEGAQRQAAQLSEDTEGDSATILLRLDQDVPDPATFEGAAREAATDALAYMDSAAFIAATASALA